MYFITNRFLILSNLQKFPNVICKSILKENRYKFLIVCWKITPFCENFYRLCKNFPILKFYSTSTLKITQKVGFIGDGNMAKAICRSIKRKGQFLSKALIKKNIQGVQKNNFPSYRFN